MIYKTFKKDTEITLHSYVSGLKVTGTGDKDGIVMVEIKLARNQGSIVFRRSPNDRLTMKQRLDQLVSMLSMVQAEF